VARYRARNERSQGRGEKVLNHKKDTKTLRPSFVILVVQTSLAVQAQQREI
jgi:hypothetical protein